MHLLVWRRDRRDEVLAHVQRLGVGLHSIRPHYLRPPQRAGLLVA